MDQIVDINTLFGPLPSAASDLSVDELVLLMGRHSVRAACTLSTVGLLLDHNAGNAATRAAAAENRSLIPTATINPQAWFGGDGLHTRLKADGFKLVRFFPGSQGWVADYEPFVALLGALAEDGLPVMVEVSRPGDATRLVRAAGGFAGPLILAGVDESAVSEALALMRTHKNLYCETSSLLATGALKHAVSIAGADRILYGSGAPARPMASGMGVLRHAGLGDGERAAVLGGNAHMLLGLS